MSWMRKIREGQKSQGHTVWRLGAGEAGGGLWLGEWCSFRHKEIKSLTISLWRDEHNEEEHPNTAGRSQRVVTCVWPCLKSPEERAAESSWHEVPVIRAQNKLCMCSRLSSRDAVSHCMALCSWSRWNLGRFYLSSSSQYPCAGSREYLSSFLKVYNSICKLETEKQSWLCNFI